MREKIIEKMTDYIKQILEKEEIGQEEFLHLQSFLGFLDSESAKKKAEESMSKSEEKLKALMGLAFGGD